jgi:phosphoribosylanthranilate isomerase
LERKPAADSDRTPRIQVKVCGLTDPQQAAACADLGADAVGLIFYPPSPRYVEPSKAAAIAAALRGKAAAVGVFVNVATEEILAGAERCGLTAVQLHGNESPEQVVQLKRAGVRVIKALFLEKDPRFARTAAYTADAFLLECGLGKLPGGNARRWDWSQAAGLAQVPTILAGGLDPDNVARAVSLARPDAVDVSSGVEAAPGCKDLKKVEAFIAAVRGTTGHRTRQLFE